MPTAKDESREFAWGEAGLDRSEQFELKRQAVLRTAAKHFAAQGYHRTLLEDVARELNINKATLYHYFSGKHEILYEIHRGAIASITNREPTEKAKCANGAEHLESFVDRYIDMLRDDFGACLVVTGTNTFEPESRAKCIAGRREINDMLVEILEEGMNDGSLRKCDAKSIAAFIFGTLNWTCHWYHPDGEISVDQLKERAMDFIVNGLRA
jgi:AcrR family transcriptional regulator